MSEIRHNALVSVALATFNGEAYLELQLESIVAQSYKNIEVIISDDKSSDSTLDIIELFKDKLNLKLFQNEKKIGVIKNFEKAISFCRGDFIALCDQDDIWEEDKIEQLVNQIDDYDLICSNVTLIDEMNEKIAESWLDFQMIDVPSEKYQFKKIIYQNFALGCTILFNERIKKKMIPIPLEAEGHDWWIALIASLNGKIKFLDKKLVKKRIHKNNVSEIYRNTTYKRFRKYFSKEAMLIKEKHYHNSLLRLNYYINNNLYRTADEKKYLEDMVIYYSNYLATFLHIKTFTVAFKYRNILFENLSFSNRSIHILSKLFG